MDCHTDDDDDHSHHHDDEDRHKDDYNDHPYRDDDDDPHHDDDEDLHDDDDDKYRFNHHDYADGGMTLLLLWYSKIHLSQLSFNSSLVVIIGDVNDNSPKFSRTSYQASIPENTQKVTVMDFQIKSVCGLPS